MKPERSHSASTLVRLRWISVFLLVAVTIGAGGSVFRLMSLESSEQPSGSSPEVGSSTSQERRTVTQPRLVNVVLFLIDTLRADRVGAYGYARPTSPFMDALADQGVLFEQCYAPAPWTLPSVVSMLTSTWPCDHGVLVDGDRVDERIELLAQKLKRAGYATASFYSNPYAGPVSSLDRGYDVCRQQRGTDGPVVDAWLDTVGDQPFFIYIHNIEPHNPYDAPDNTALQDEAMGRIAEVQESIRVLYDAAVRLADERVGSVIDVLKRRGLWENTLFVALSDHGEEFADHGGWLHDQSVYEELIRVPLIVRFPEDAWRGKRVQQAVTLVDLVPTLGEYLRRPDLFEGCRGSSVMPLVSGSSPVGAHPMAVVSMRINKKKYYRPYKETRGDFNVVVRDGHWKAIWNREIGTIELYDLASDPRERIGLVTREHERAEPMRGFAETWLQTRVVDVAREPGAQQTELDAEALERLRSLGYVE
jgi:arylsulfatase A-like enzyme